MSADDERTLRRLAGVDAYLVDLIEPADIIQEATIARARGAEFVVVDWLIRVAGRLRR